MSGAEAKQIVAVRMAASLVDAADLAADRLAEQSGCRVSRSDVLRLALQAYLRGAGTKPCRCGKDKGVAA
jgi:hypothetical protein